jgi:hypothetical protein
MRRGPLPIELPFGDFFSLILKVEEKKKKDFTKQNI